MPLTNEIANTEFKDPENLGAMIRDTHARASDDSRNESVLEEITQLNKPTHPLLRNSESDDKQRRATMLAFIRSTYPPDREWYLHHPFYDSEKDGDYWEWLRNVVFDGKDPEEKNINAMSNELREHDVGNVGIPDEETLALVLSHRRHYNSLVV
ncbi:hypothetical protein DL766_003491 [Monosporascus sp. MC13-8B]|uniref:Uncharacterized protein n=1 Tax=Monosporascus cannonballus TaxID=155416 RepID=A0ABY0HNX2_9PEZI|nr:hypothetical protein DL763_005361 [Monosporascus cannonballus]RYO95468.1 hypothetical protein DL762_000030 [Monosporascus cannonballus]RYP33360.1 hypothetical protein DL766_003491 [Monosporascus sp. MC13-8B]